MRSIPFRLPDTDAGLTEIKGLLYLDDEFLVLEIETALLGEFRREQQVVKVEPAALEEVHLEHGVFRDRLRIRPRKRELLRVVPGKHLGELQLKIWKKYREPAERLVEAVRRASAHASRGR